MYHRHDLLDKVFSKQYQDLGLRKLKILTGYASSTFLAHILEKYNEIEVDLIIGMARKDGINEWDHENYKQLMYENPKLNVRYYTGLPGIHAKVYHWHDDFLQEPVTFVGSANFSWNGFRDQIEVMVESSPFNIEEIFNIANTTRCTDANVDKKVNFNFLSHQKVFNSVTHYDLSESYTTRRMIIKEFVDLPLSINEDSIQEVAVLNWGQRQGRDANEAYLKVPTLINRDNPDFFPPRAHEFSLITDDRERFICTMAQADRKAIHTPRDNTIFGIYFRKRLGVPLGQRVDVQDLQNYGRHMVRIYKINPETYFMDFSPDKPK